MDNTLTLKKIMECLDQLKDIPAELKFITSPHLTVTKSKQTFFSRSRKKRITKKCAKKYRMTWEEPNPEMFYIKETGVVVGHPATIRLIVGEIAK